MAPPVGHHSPQPEEPAIHHDHFGFRPWVSLWPGTKERYRPEAIRPYKHILGNPDDPYPFCYDRRGVPDAGYEKKKLAPIDPARQYGGPIFGEQVNDLAMRKRVEMDKPVPIDMTQFHAERAADRELHAQRMADLTQVARNRAVQLKALREEATQLPSPRISPTEKAISEESLPVKVIADSGGTTTLPEQ